MKHCLFLSLLACTAAAGPRPLVNGGFEDGLDGWTLDGSASVAEVTASAAALGAKGLRIQDAGTDRWQLLGSPLPAKPGGVYVLSYWAQGRAEPGTINVSILFADAAGKALKSLKAERRYWPGVPIKTRPGWFDQSVAKAVAPEGAATVRVAIAPIARKPRAADIDDITLAEEIAGETPSSDLDALLAEIAADPTRGRPAPVVVLKLDDLKDRNGRVHPRWQRAVDFALRRRVKIDIGIVAESLEGDKPDYFQWIKDQRAGGMIGFWWHGWDHREWTENGKKFQEFNQTPYEHQKVHLADSQRLAREKLGFAFVAFGAPFNSTDETTVKVLGEDPDIRVWMYAPFDADTDKIKLGRSFSTNLEQPTFVANYAAFIEGYAHNRGTPYLVLQGHPMQWDDERYDNFTRIVDFLVAQRAEFVFAEEFATRENLRALISPQP